MGWLVLATPQYEPRPMPLRLLQASTIDRSRRWIKVAVLSSEMRTLLDYLAIRPLLSSYDLHWLASANELVNTDGEQRHHVNCKENYRESPVAIGNQRHQPDPVGNEHADNEQY